LRTNEVEEPHLLSYIEKTGCLACRKNKSLQTGAICPVLRI